jgi:extracellular factor (EF) 3-hydroxypalmitic acid methyl ester biosynthesis protein
MQTTSKITISTTAPLIAPPIHQKTALDSVHGQLQAGRIAGALDELFDDLRARREEDPEDWPAYARACLSHPVCGLLHQDPFTYRAFAKPRGYAGDAVMMDYIYGMGEAGEAARNATPLGRAIFQHMDTRPSAKAVRFRRRLIVDLIDQVARRKTARVLAVAAGHLREVEISRAMQSGKVQEFVAFDQDESSLAVIARDYAHLGVQTMPGSVRQILSGKAKLGQYDFVYAAGLFDYLSGPVASALTRRMFEMTRPGGLMLIPNFLAGAADTGYMEAFMDWRLIYRNHSDMMALAATLPRSAVADCQVFDDSDDAITCLLVSKAS